MKKDYQFLSGSNLKWIAMVSMFLDHFNKGVLLNYIILRNDYSPNLNTLNSILAILGRFAFPIFLFLLVEGMVHTKSRMKYIRNLLIFALISEIPYNMFESGEFFSSGGQNMFFTLALAGSTIWLIEIIKNKKFKLWQLAIFFITIYSGFISSYLGFDYNYYGIFIPVAFYLLRNKRLAATIVGYLLIIKELFSLPGFMILNLYNGKRGNINKWIGYIFYPAHLLVIGLIRMYVIKA